MTLLLKVSGYHISVVTPKIYKKSHYFEEHDGIKIYRFPFFSGNRLLIEYKRIPYLRMLVFYITGFFLTMYVMFKQRCHLIHAHWAIPTGLIGTLAAALLRTPLIVTVHGSDFRMGTMKTSILKRIFVYVCKEAKHIICVSEMLKRGIEDLGIKREKISVLSMGVDEVFLETWKNHKINLRNHDATILSNRRFLPIYNMSLLIRAIPIVLKEEPHSKFLIAGDGPERENCEKQIKNLDVSSSVVFLGWVVHEEMPTLLSRADIYVSTSLDDGTSVSLLEAMASGAFPIVTDIPANREWISDGKNGFLVPTGNEYILAAKIVEAIRNKELLAKANAKNRKLIEQKAHWKTNIRKIANIYESTSMAG